MNSSPTASLRRAAPLVLVSIAAAVAFGVTPPADTGAAPRELTLRPFRGLVTVPIRIGDSEPLNFVIDSGSEHTTLNDADLARALNLHTRQAGVGTGMGGARLPVRIAPDVAIHAFDGELFRTDLAVHHLRMLLADETGRDLHGLLGSELFERYVVEIDPGRSVVVLHEPGSFSYQGPGHVIPLAIDQRRPFVKARITTVNGKRVKVRLMVDTGSENHLALMLGVHRHLQVPENHQEVTALGVGGKTSVLVGPVSGLTIGDLALDRTPASFFQPGSMPAAQTIRKFDGLIGNGVLGQHKTILDYHRKQLILEDL